MKFDSRFLRKTIAGDLKQHKWFHLNIFLWFTRKPGEIDNLESKKLLNKKKNSRTMATWSNLKILLVVIDFFFLVVILDSRFLLYMRNWLAHRHESIYKLEYITKSRGFTQIHLIVMQFILGIFIVFGLLLFLRQSYVFIQVFSLLFISFSIEALIVSISFLSHYLGYMFSSF